MSKQDRTYTRTAADLERKYNLGGNPQGGTDNSEQLSKFSQELSEHKTQANNKFKDIQTEIDVVSALAKANKAAHEANASAIKTNQAEVERVSGRVTIIEDWKGGLSEATSLDIQGMFVIGE